MPYLDIRLVTNNDDNDSIVDAAWTHGVYQSIKGSSWSNNLNKSNIIKAAEFSGQAI